MVSGGYPDEYRTGYGISGLDHDGPEETLVFHAGTKLGPSGETLTAGGRVLTVVGGGETMEEARRRAYSRVEQISFTDARWRRDIGSAANQGTARLAG